MGEELVPSEKWQRFLEALKANERFIKIAPQLATDVSNEDQFDKLISELGGIIIAEAQRSDIDVGSITADNHSNVTVAGHDVKQIINNVMQVNQYILIDGQFVKKTSEPQKPRDAFDPFPTLENPQGAVSIESPFYVSRRADEQTTNLLSKSEGQVPSQPSREGVRLEKPHC